MSKDYRPEPQDGFDSFIPSYEDWREMCDYFDQLDAEEMDQFEREAFEEANRELVAVDSPF
jgi:hypothetical protein